MNYDQMDDLLSRKYTLQRDILDSWAELQRIKQKHTELLSKLHTINEQIKQNSEPDLFDQLFNTATPES